MQKKAGIIGLGLIGGSIGLALCEEGWEVIGRDIDPSRVNDAKTMGAITDEGSMGDCEIVFVATPVSGIANPFIKLSKREQRLLQTLEV